MCEEAFTLKLVSLCDPKQSTDLVLEPIKRMTGSHNIFSQCWAWVFLVHIYCLAVYIALLCAHVVKMLLYKRCFMFI